MSAAAAQDCSKKRWRQCINTLVQWFTEVQLEEAARQSGFLRRRPRKITPLLFLQASVLLISQSAVSLSRWAVLLGVLGRTSLSKQSLCERITPGAVGFLERVLALVIARRVRGSARPRPEALKVFGRVLIQDSTTIGLTDKLAAAFPGSSNQRGPRQGLLKIQAVYELFEQRFVHFGLSGFNRNDQAASPDILSLLRPGDLVLRDLGYFVIHTFEQIAQKGAFFLSRLRMDATLRDPHTGKELNLLGLLKKKGGLDRRVLLGERRMPVRLVALKLPEPVAAERRRKARMNRDKRCRPDRRKMQLLGWAIFVTNVPREDVSARTLAELYTFRWQIETLFKVWKSHFGLTAVTKGSPDQLRAMIYARLVFITVLAQVVRVNWQDPHAGREPVASLFKIAAMLGNYLLPLCLQAWGIDLEELLIEQFDYHGRHDRRSRQNATQKFMNLS